MKIKVPEYVLKHNLNDNELLFSCFMAYLAKEVSYKNTRYYMYSDDIKHILGFVSKHPTKNSMSADSRRTHAALGNIVKVFKFGIINDGTWTVEFPGNPEHNFRNGALRIAEVEITDQKVIGLYYYLAGRLTAEDVVDERIIIDRKKTSWLDTSLKPFFREHFML